MPILAGASQQPPAPPVPFAPPQSREDSLQKQLASLETQRQAVRQQVAGKVTVAGPASAQFIEPLPVWNPPLNPVSLPVWNPAGCQPLTAGKVDELVTDAARRQSLDPALLRAVIKKESAFRPCAVSPKGAQGLMQLMPSIAQDLHVADAFDPQQNVQAGAAYLKRLLGRYKGDVRLALVGYNAGPGRADLPGDTPYPLETQDYVASILATLGIGPAGGAQATDSLPPAAASGLLTEPPLPRP